MFYFRFAMSDGSVFFPPRLVFSPSARRSEWFQSGFSSGFALGENTKRGGKSLVIGIFQKHFVSVKLPREPPDKGGEGLVFFVFFFVSLRIFSILLVPKFGEF
ncbi:MAG: hypothetical protein DYG98_22195 [Haliscomenobacteraceae bacterium CHB4]|nr:hypothetical protein [Haliscomenobacteraceae bacterium CHB4]